MNTPSIAATLDLTDDTQRQVCEAMRRMHTGPDSLIGHMWDLQRVGAELIELASWREGGFAVVRWSLTTVGLRWHEYATMTTAHVAFMLATR